MVQVVADAQTLVGMGIAQLKSAVQFCMHVVLMASNAPSHPLGPRNISAFAI